MYESLSYRLCSENFCHYRGGNQIVIYLFSTKQTFLLEVSLSELLARFLQNSDCPLTFSSDDKGFIEEQNGLDQLISLSLIQEVSRATT